MPLLTPEELGEIRERCEKATSSELPWEETVRLLKEHGTSAEYELSGHARKFWVARVRKENDRVFIFHSRTDMPRLLELVEALQERLEWHNNHTLTGKRRSETCTNSDCTEANPCYPCALDKIEELQAKLIPAQEPTND